MQRPILLFIVTFIIFSHLAFAEDARNKQATRLVGWWKEYSPSSNLIHFSQDGTVKLLLKKGEIGDLHSLDGTWAIVKESNVQMVFSANGETHARDATLSFSDNEMILIEADGTETRHRRHSGAIPKKYLW